MKTNILEFIDSRPWTLTLIALLFTSVTLIFESSNLSSLGVIFFGLGAFVGGGLLLFSTKYFRKRRHAYWILEKGNLINEVWQKVNIIENEIKGIGGKQQKSLYDLILSNDKLLSQLCRRISRVIQKCEKRIKGDIDVDIFLISASQKSDASVPIKAGSSNSNTKLLEKFPVIENTDFEEIWGEVNSRNNREAHFISHNLKRLGEFKDSNHYLQDESVPPEYFYEWIPFWKRSRFWKKNEKSWGLDYQSLISVPLLEFDHTNNATVVGFLTISSSKCYDLSEANIRLAQLLAYQLSIIPTELNSKSTK